MADNMSKEKRTKTMKAIRSQSKLENIFTKALWKKGYRFRKNSKTLFGKPDISIKKYKIVIFIDSCFWHVCPLHSNEPKSNQDYWKSKLLRNQQRDKKVNEYYRENGWHIKRIWEHEIKEDFDKAIADTCDFIDKVTINSK
ncbi:very short patch repair endonuclease [Bacillus sonorensis]|uniref:very short patch repair endonuclease n=1 Tax=Bacillus sonorensis TaxID=119858 RepID=UPI002DBA5BA1|nr:very short patch repair endonuclease [Bacillus sonorensis]MEC1356515.1 very short patch repair endonuclease [Bacillus sonorensis]MEC1427801.1 very short patch repair endonuclease [Bacillus sonorensis]MEC1439209.1 very short patch repair endonuclease [Bacillus sonorensis]